METILGRLKKQNKGIMKHGKISTSLIVFLSFGWGGLPFRAQAPAKPEVLIPRDRVIEDVRQMVTIIEAVHPDPYIEGGGKIAFHRRYQQILNGVPEQGLAKADLYSLLNPFFQAIGDLHTGISRRSAGLVLERKPGIPLDFRLIEENIYISGVYDTDLKSFLGSYLIALEGIPISELVERQKQLAGYENAYTNLSNLIDSVHDDQSLRRLVPELGMGNTVKMTFSGPEGGATDLSLSLGARNRERVLIPASRVRLPSTERSDPSYRFLDKEKKIALLKVETCFNYREAQEYIAKEPSGISQLKTVYKRFNNNVPPDDPLKLLQGIPAAMDIFRSLVQDMKNAQTKSLLVDLRDNGGGFSSLSYLLIYVLYGLNAMESANDTYSIPKYSERYFQGYSPLSLEEINKTRSYNLILGDYNFDSENEALHPKLKEHEKRDDKKTYSWLGSTFIKEVDSGRKYEAYYRPQNVIVLVNTYTGSSAFELMAMMSKLGAKVVGSPSSQKGNFIGVSFTFTMKHSGLVYWVPCKKIFYYPNDPGKFKIVHPDYELTYQQLRTFGFDPNAEVLLALEILDNC